MANAGFTSFSEAAPKDATARTEHMGGLYPPQKWTESVIFAMMEEAMCNRSNNFNPANTNEGRNCWKPNPIENKYTNPDVQTMLANGLELFDSKSEKHNAPQTERASERGTDKVHVPGVGDVPYVDMKKSHEITQNADHQLADRDPHSYNCLYYLKTVLEGHPPNSVSPSMEGMPSGQYMKDHGYEKAPHGELKTGDVVLISIPNPNGGVPTEHAGIVIGKTKDGEPIIRQKPDADHPPIDLTQSQFEACYCQGKTIEQQRAAHQAGVYRQDA